MESVLADSAQRVLVIAPGPHGEILPSLAPALAASKSLVILDAQAVRIGRVSAKLPGAAGRGVLGRAPRLPFRRHSFHAVVAVEALFAIRPPWTVIAEFHRVLVPDGRLILLEPAREGVFSKLRSRLVGPGKRVFALEEVKSRLARADFAIERGEERAPAAGYPAPANLIVAVKKENMAEPVPQVTTTREMRAKQRPYPKGEELP
ncbi:MAG: class I SAM-dependent methyltransferase [Planctomycetota bacterium]|nr:class I SAM-dependent methyltransferase [Planctomycetota bacterium]